MWTLARRVASWRVNTSPKRRCKGTKSRQPQKINPPRSHLLMRRGVDLHTTAAWGAEGRRGVYSPGCEPPRFCLVVTETQNHPCYARHPPDPPTPPHPTNKAPPLPSGGGRVRWRQAASCSSTRG
jgi:hypothetical protein